MVDEHFQWKSSCQNLLASGETYSTFMVLQVRKRGEYSVVSGSTLQSVNNEISKGIRFREIQPTEYHYFRDVNIVSLLYLKQSFPHFPNSISLFTNSHFTNQDGQHHNILCSWVLFWLFGAGGALTQDSSFSVTYFMFVSRKLGLKAVAEAWCRNWDHRANQHSPVNI